jgi:hypothetical protein
MGGMMSGMRGAMGGMGGSMMGGRGMGGMMRGGNAHDVPYDVMTINGKAYPATEPLRVQKGERVRLRFITPFHQGKSAAGRARDVSQASRDVVEVAPVSAAGTGVADRKDFGGAAGMLALKQGHDLRAGQRRTLEGARSGMVNLANIVLAGAALTLLFACGVVDLVWVVGGFFCWVVLFTGATEAIGEAVWW